MLVMGGGWGLPLSGGVVCVGDGNSVGTAGASVEASPVFIAGCGRSGTTLVRTWLNAHPEMFVPTESLFLSDYVEYACRIPDRVLRFLFFREPQLLCWYRGPRVPLTPIGEGICKVHAYAARQAGARVWGQKTPRFVRHIESFERQLVGIRWILVHRDPRGVAASMRRSKRHTSSIKRAVARWKRDNGPVVRALDGWDGERAGRVLVVSYERLLAEPEREWRRICGFAGIEPIELGVVAENASTERLQRSRFDNNAVRESAVPDQRHCGAWREELDAEEVAFIETACSGEMKRYGYERVSSRDRRTTPYPMRELARQVGDVRIVIEYARRWPEYLVWTLLRKVVLMAGRAIVSCRRVN